MYGHVMEHGRVENGGAVTTATGRGVTATINMGTADGVQYRLIVDASGGFVLELQSSTRGDEPITIARGELEHTADGRPRLVMPLQTVEPR